MRKHCFFILTLFTFFISSFCPDVTFAISRTTSDVVGTVSVPIFEVFLLSAYLLLTKYLCHVHLSFDRKNFLKPFKNSYYTALIILPIFITASINYFTAKQPIQRLLHNVPLSQILLGLSLSLLSSFVVGFFEETIMRGGMLSYFIVIFNKQKNGMLLSVILSSLIFGMAHLGNAFFGQSLIYTLYQVGYAFSMGFMMAALYIKFKTLLIPIMIHGLIDWTDMFFNMSGEPLMHGIEWAPILIFVIFMISGYLIYKTITSADRKVFKKSIGL